MSEEIIYSNIQTKIIDNCVNSCQWVYDHHWAGTGVLQPGWYRFTTCNYSEGAYNNHCDCATPDGSGLSEEVRLTLCVCTDCG